MAKQMICSACGHVSSGKSVPKGSMGVEIALWLFFIIPGLVYSIWRMSSYHKACTVCGSTNLIPIDSPNGVRLLEQQGKTLEEVKAKATKEVPKPMFLKVFIGAVVVMGVILLGMVLLTVR